ncbi:MAG: hypothetical protein J0L52_10920 [Caulobacterales bacterium]|nr:hypothetical protein [Caulobacterales bacterium]
MPLTLAFAATLALAIQDGPMMTARVAPTESAESVRRREAMAYAYPLPTGVPADDFGFLGYCDGLISGHVQLGETLGDGADAELMRLGRLERQDFESARAVGGARATPAQIAVAQGAYDRAMTRWQPYLNNTNADERQAAFDLFFGLPGRCEHAARRVRANITAAPATLQDVGLTPEEVLPPSLLEPTTADEEATDVPPADE